MFQKKRRNKKTLYRIVSKIRLVAFDFDGVFTNNQVLVLQDGTEGVLCNRSDGLGLRAIKDHGIAILVISTEVNPVVSARCKKLDLNCIQGSDNKLKVLEEEAEKLNISLREVAYLGNDINDLECLKKVGLSACVADSYPEILKVCKYITQLLGGKGAVREFCDFILKARNGKLS
ncbi:HAD hydrolase family protein [bacterium]|nr:HAD hydrolase family protein [bacterium]